jgi:hypothetical protein
MVSDKAERKKQNLLLIIYRLAESQKFFIKERTNGTIFTDNVY